ncbi:hypothetical protein [Paenibacillus cookii]|uniref:Uncharacterized protein n=1 Tax=Paenibacillus cookii TaxID=157839 RepID=A0ABQ4LZ67_9BACL|nr:hypothetical protein [Paenibacillus cookii]GIO68586.1 hypothetical protein J21TS3_34070 [Paenibacillus cookii]
MDMVIPFPKARVSILNPVLQFHIFIGYRKHPIGKSAEKPVRLLAIPLRGGFSSIYFTIFMYA